MTMIETLVDVLHVLRDVRRERHVYREIALCAIHRLHEQHVLIARQRRHIRRLSGELHGLRSGGHSSHICTVQSADRIGRRALRPRTIASQPALTHHA
jgi:hypothetical protein